MDKICFDWENTNFEVYVCSGDGSSLTNGQELELSCVPTDKTDCSEI